MKKQILFLTTILMSGNALAQASLDKCLAFKEMKFAQKMDWKDFKHAGIEQRTTLYEKHKIKKLELFRKNMEALANLQECTPEAKENLLKNNLDNAIVLYKECMADWKAYSEERKALKDQIREKHLKEIQTFIGKPIAPEEYVAFEKEVATEPIEVTPEFKEVLPAIIEETPEDMFIPEQAITPEKITEEVDEVDMVAPLAIDEYLEPAFAEPEAPRENAIMTEPAAPVAVDEHSEPAFTEPEVPREDATIIEEE